MKDINIKKAESGTDKAKVITWAGFVDDLLLLKKGLSQTVFLAVTLIGGPLCLIVSLIGPLCLIGSTYIWLKDGTWNPVESVWVLKTFAGLQDWLASPDAWFGLHKVVDVVIHWPWAMLSIPTAYILLIIWVNCGEKVE